MSGRVYRAAVVAPPENPKGRVFRAGVVGAAGAATPRGRVFRSGFTGTPPTARKGRVYGTRVSGTPAVVLAPIASRTVEPMTVVEITALLTGGTPAQSYVWRQISGPAVQLTGTEHTRSFVAPSSLDGAVVVLGVRGVVGGTSSSETSVTITTLPQIVWTRTNADPAWRGTKLTF